MKMLQQRRNMYLKHLMLIGFLVMCSIRSINTEVYTALAEMEELLETETVLISNLEGFIKVQQEKLDYLKT